MKLEELPEYVDNFRRRVLADALQEATAHYWRGRAAALESARPGGYVWATDLRRHKSGCTRLKCSESECPFVHRAGERKTDWPGRAAPDELRARDAELAAGALACRERAVVSLGGEFE